MTTLVLRGKRVDKLLAAIAVDFAKNFDLLKNDVLNEDEFNKANVTRREERTRLSERQVELTAWIAQQHDRLEIGSALPTQVRSSRIFCRSTYEGPRRYSSRS